jgi:glycosyltransferase involved in cell wall biosynthesis
VEPHVSFIVPCYNYAHFVPRAINSLLAQTHQSIDIIAINDASSDGTTEVLKQFSDEPRVRVIHHNVNQGHIRTYNEGISLARGEFIGLLSADDMVLKPHAVERQLAVFDAHPRVGFVYTASEFIDDNDRRTWEYRPFPADYVRSGLEEFAHLIRANYVPASGTLVRRRCHEELGDYDVRLPHAADWDLWLRLTTRYDVGYIAEQLVGYRIHDMNMSHTSVSSRQANDEVIRTIEKAFDALPRDAPAGLTRLRSAALAQAAVRTTEIERGNGRLVRAWLALSDAATRSPRLVATAPFRKAFVQLALTTALGPRSYTKLSEWRNRRKAAAAQPLATRAAD